MKLQQEQACTLAGKEAKTNHSTATFQIKCRERLLRQPLLCNNLSAKLANSVQSLYKPFQHLKIEYLRSFYSELITYICPVTEGDYGKNYYYIRHINALESMDG